MMFIGNFVIQTGCLYQWCK